MACTDNRQLHKIPPKIRGHYQSPYGSDYKNTRSTRQGIQEGDLTKDSPIQEPKNEATIEVFPAVK